MSSAGALHHADRVLSALGDNPDRGAIAQSWNRCLTRHKLDPERPEPPLILSAAELRQARDIVGRMLCAADPELDRLYNLVAPLGYAVFVADTEGVAVARRVAELDAAACRYWGLWTGALWNEAVEGTNAGGTCLAEQRPVTVHRDQHFRTRHTRLTCTATPLYDATGRLAGALDISSFRPDPTGRILNLAMAVTCDTARRIEARCFRHAYAKQLIVSLPAAEESISVPLLALDGDRRVIGATRAARDLLALDEASISAGVSLPDLADDAARPGALAHAARTVLAGALSTTQGNVAAAARALGISRATMHRKIRQFGLQPRRREGRPAIADSRI